MQILCRLLRFREFAFKYLQTLQLFFHQVLVQSVSPATAGRPNCYRLYLLIVPMSNSQSQEGTA